MGKDQIKKNIICFIEQTQCINISEQIILLKKKNNLTEPEQSLNEKE